MHIYPNPVSNTLTVELINIVNQNVKLTISDVLGTVIYEDRILAVQNKINRNYSFSDISNGFYFLTINFGENTITKKIIFSK